MSWVEIVLAVWLVILTWSHVDHRRTHDRELKNYARIIADARTRGFELWETAKKIYKALGREIKELKK